MEQTTAIYRSMLADITARFSIEKKAVDLCGFSGGSRVAGSIAVSYTHLDVYKRQTQLEVTWKICHSNSNNAISFTFISYLNRIFV